MTRKLTLILACILLHGVTIFAQKQIYIPQQMKQEGYSETDESKQWCKVRSRESDNIVVFWGSGYGKNDPNSSSVPSEYRVDIDDLLAKLESFYDLNINKLKFAEVGVGKSNLDKYKMVICLYYTTDWMAYGSGFDDLIGGMWISPSTCHPVGSTIAHEIGHSFQYQCSCDLKGAAGFRYNVGTGCGYWEQTAQWQSYQAYPEEVFENYNFTVYTQNYHRAFTHEWQRYASYFFHYYQVDKHGIDIIGRIWRGAEKEGMDANEVYMALTNLSVKDFYKECYDAAAKFATWDIDELRERGKNYIGRQEYNYYDVGDNKVQVAYESCPQSTGYNLVPLNVPQGGGEIEVVFTALPAGRPLPAGDPGICNKKDDGSYETTTAYNKFSGFLNRGFRHGYVALLSNGERIYQSVDTVYATGNSTVSDTTKFMVPENTERLWFVVSPAPKTYFVHKWDEEEKNDDQWPYQLEFKNTDIVGHVNIGDPTEAVHDTIVHCYIGIEPNSESYEGTTVMLNGELGNAIGKAFKLQPKQIANCIKEWSTSQSDNTITFWALRPGNYGLLPSKGNTSNQYGHWFNKKGEVADWGRGGAVFSDYIPSAQSFVIGQMPGSLVKGDQINIGQAFRYKKDGKIVTAKVIFHIYVGGVPVGIDAVENNGAEKKVDVYTLQGIRVKSQVEPSTATDGLPKGIYIVGKKKVAVK